MHNRLRMPKPTLQQHHMRCTKTIEYIILRGMGKLFKRKFDSLNTMPTSRMLKKLYETR